VRVVAASQPLLPPVIQEGMFDAVSEALYQDPWLNIDYRNAQDTRRQAEVMPLGFSPTGLTSAKLMGRVWYSLSPI